MRSSRAAVGLIRMGQADQPLWLVQWNEHWRMFNLISGHIEENESYRECLMREIEEELGLIRDEEFAIPAHPFGRLEFTARSERAGEDTDYIFELFEVRLRGNSSIRKIASNPNNRWLTREEIRKGRCFDGKPVNSRIEEMLLLLEARGLHGG